MILLYIYIAIIGLVIGCFLNVCIYRIPEKQSIINPPSHCPECGTRLKPLDLVPVFSYIFLKGKCRYCGSKVSARYPIVEAITSAIFVILFYKYSVTVEFVAAAFLASILISITFIDVDHKIIPNSCIIVGLAGGFILFVYNIFYQVTFFGDRLFFTPLIGMVSGAGFLLLVSILGQLLYKTDDAMGMGDVKLLAVCGLFLGWKLTIVLLFIAIIVAAVFSMILLITKKQGSRSTIAFGPFISIGAVTAMIFGWDIINIYCNLLPS